ncbi:MAG: FTR1 family protein [Alphaproteobacteria bacterium]|nr:FTR1 family protein [Alphaproteobacteria bacterium]
MIGALIIVFREVIEAGLIIGIIMAATQTVIGSQKWIWSGVLAGIGGSAVLAAFTGSIASLFDGYGSEIFNAAILAVAVCMLIWHNVWMAKNGRALAGELKQAGIAVREGHKSLLALAIIVGVAVLREGSEVVLFLYGVAISAKETAWGMATGGIGGLALGAAVSFLTFRGLLKIPNRYFFSVTSWLIAFLAAGMAAQSVSFLEKAGLVEVLQKTVWDTSSVISQSGILGRILHTLIGYSDQPTALQLLAYVSVLALGFALTKWISRPKLNAV